jgi:hypothetical protein
MASTCSPIEAMTWSHLRHIMDPSDLLAVVLVCLIHENGGAIEVSDKTLREVMNRGSNHDFDVVAPRNGCGISLIPA